MGKISPPAPSLRSNATFVARVQQLTYQLVRLMERCDELCLAEHDITVAQAYTLLCVPAVGDVRMNSLSEAIGVAGSTATRMVDQLARKGLVERISDPEDRRIVRVRLTQAGKEQRGQLEAAATACFTLAFGHVAQDERSATVRVLEQLTDSLAKALEVTRCCSVK